MTKYYNSKTEHHITYITEEEGGKYRLVNGNSQSIDAYDDYDDAKKAMEADNEAHENSKDAKAAQENSPVEWEC